MNVFRSISLATRKLSILLAIIFLLSVSLLLYYFKYIPGNKERLQHEGFLILQQQQNGILQNLDDLKGYFCVQKQRFYKEQNTNIDTNITIFKQYKDRPINYNIKFSKRKKTFPPDSTEADSCNPVIGFDLDEKSDITFQFTNNEDILVFNVSLDQLFEKALDATNVVFFQHHFVVCKQHSKAQEENPEGEKSHHDGDSSEKNPHILYHSPGLAVSEHLQTDSLGKMLASAQFSRIIDVEVTGSQYKAFMLPFQLAHNTFILAGLIPGSEYRQRLQSIPFSTVSAIIIIFILILICLPYIKVFFISQEEHFGIRDIVLLGITLFAGTAILLIVFQQLLMQTGAQLRVKNKLSNLNGTINTRLHDDIANAYYELKYLDSTLKKKIDSNEVAASSNTDTNRHKLIVKCDTGNKLTYSLPFIEKSNFPNYTVVHWANDKGRQIFRGNIGDTFYSFSDISDRQYFKDVKTKHLYSFSNRQGDLSTISQIDSFTLQPVYSMSYNSFGVNIAIHGRVTAMAALFAKLPSVMNTVMPQGYGFYVIDNRGVIMFQSRGTVTLQENFLEWINDKEDIANTIKNRQIRFVANKYVNDRQFSLFIRPIDQLPLHLIVFHCNDYTTASLLHINAFTLFFSFILFAMVLIFCLVAWNKTNHFSRLNQPIYQYDWMIPGLSKSKFFINANAYLIFYTLITVFYCCIIRLSSAIWFIGLMCPIFTVWTTYLLFRLHINFKRSVPPEKNIATITRYISQPYNLIALIFLGLLDIIYFKIEPGASSRIYLLFYELISLMFIPLAIIKFSKFFEKKYKDPDAGASAKPLPEKKYENPDEETPAKPLPEKMVLYNYFWFWLVVAVSIVPVSCFFVYAQEKEINLLTKARQLDVAENVENRLLKFNWLDNVEKKREISVEQKRSMLFDEGVYDNKCTPVEEDIPDASKNIVNEPYDKVIRAISWDYYSLDKILPLQDTASDKKWFRNDSVRQSPSQMTLIYKLGAGNKGPNTFGNINSLEIRDTGKSIFVYFLINAPISVTIIVLSSIILLVLFYRLIRTIAGRLFHPWGFKNQEDINLDNINVIRKYVEKDEFDEYKGINKVLDSVTGNAEKKYQALRKVWEKEYDHCEYDKENMATKENEILYTQYHLSPLYDRLWDSCSDEEKYFLFDMSGDGFSNYKRVRLVQQLLYKGLLECDENEGLKIMSVSFRNYILDKAKTDEIFKLREQFHVQGTWSKLRTPILITITAAGTFLFITQQNILQQIAALVPTLSAVLGLGTLILGSKSKTVSS